MSKRFRHGAVIVVAPLLLVLADVPAGLSPVARLCAQVPLEQTAHDLESPDAAVRLRATRLLREAAPPEAAVPLARVVVDRQPEIQLEAIAAELNIFRAEKVAPRSRLGALVEGRTPISAEAAFATGPLVIGPQAVPSEVLTALRDAALGANVRVAVDGLYAFGTLASEPSGIRRREMLRTSGADLVALLNAREAAVRGAAIQVVGRVFEWRPQDGAPDVAAGDAIVAVLNDKDRSTRGLAMQALGSMRYQRGVLALTGLFEYYGKGDLAEAALAALARIAHPSSAGLFLAQLKSGNAALRATAIEGLGRIGNRESLVAIQTAVATERNAQVLLASNFASALLSNGRVEPISEALRRPGQRVQAQQYLVSLAAGRPGAFSAYLQDPDPRMRADMADALGLGRDRSALPLVMPLLQDSDPQVARAAERAIARLQ